MQSVNKNKNIKVLFYSMKRGSLMTAPSKNQSWRKYPSAVLKAQAASLISPKFPENPLALTLAIANSLCESIIEKSEAVIEQIQSDKFITHITGKTNQIETFIVNAISPNFEMDHHSPSCPEDEPATTTVDYLCSGDKPIQKKLVKREGACISAFNTPLKELKQREKLSVSSKDLFSLKRNTRTELIPLASAECEEDVRCALLQTFYRDKFAREDQINQEQNIPKPEVTRLFRKTNTRDKEQYAFDYDGQKIPIISSNSLKNNPVKVLKTIYKVNKDRTELRHGKKIHQSVRFGRFPQVAQSNRFIDNLADLHELKRGIEQNVKWAGKLQSLKLITENEEAKC